MWPRRVVWVTLLVASLCLTSSGQAQQAGRKGLVLLTAQEADQLRLPKEEWQRSSRTRSLSLGPRIVVQLPQVRETQTGHVIETVSPTTLSVLFEENRAPVDMASLQVRARKGIFTKSLTALLAPHIRGAGLQVNGVEIPDGKFRIEIEIADIDGMKTVESYGLEVRKQ